MKDRETQLAFIKARAEGKSFSTISQELGIAKATCSSWEHTLKGDIEAMKRANLEELYTEYNMAREARIESIGTIVNALDEAIANKLDRIQYLTIDKLLDLKLKYNKELREEYIEPVEVNTDDTLNGLLEQFNQLYVDSKSGKISPALIKTQISILEAKRETIFKIAGEQEREEQDPFSFDTSYTSRIIRHEDGQDAGTDTIIQA